MPKSTVVKFPTRPRAADEANALWMFAASSCFKDHYSCEYDANHQHWLIKVESSTIEGVFSLVEQCRHTLGWDIPAEWKEAVQ